MSKKLPLPEKFVQMNGYKDIYYNPVSIIHKKNLPSPIEIPSPIERPFENGLVKKSIFRDPEIAEPYDKRIMERSLFRPSPIDKRKVNSKDKNFFPSPPEKLYLHIEKKINENNETNEIYENIKNKIFNVLFYENSEKKFELVNNIITFLKENNISEDKLSLFLKNI